MVIAERRTFVKLQKREERTEAPRPPGPEDFTAGAVYRAVLLDTIQHPMTILPAAVAGVGTFYMALLDLTPTAFAITFGSALTAAAAWVFNYFVRGEELARQHVQSLRELRRELRHEEVTALVDDWHGTDHQEGRQQAEELVAAYERLSELLRRRLRQGGGPGFTLERLRILAEDTFREGTSILRQAFDVHQAMVHADGDKLERELAAWRAEGGDTPREALATRIAAHERRLALLATQDQKLDELLARSETLEAALESTCLEVLDLANPEALFERGSAADELERAMNAARNVEERMRGVSATPEDDEIYLASGRRSD